MTQSTSSRDLVLTRIIDAPPWKLFRAWTDPALLKQWFAPAPYTTPSAELDARPGGASLVVMRGPDGTEMPCHGVYLEVVENERLVITDAYTSAWEPSEKPFMTIIVTFEDLGGKTKYTALVRHWTEADREAHEKMGFHEGWGKCADQLTALVTGKTIMPSFHGKFLWYELMTSDPVAAETFYKKVIGWEAQDSGMPGMSYTILTAGGVGVGGIMELPDEACAQGASPCWMGYIGVDEVDDATRKVADAGGGILRAPADIPGIGRFSVVADPQGAAMVLFTPNMEMPGAAPHANQPGRGGWHELRAGDGPPVFAFYADLFGWTKADAVDMGPMGIYQLFATPAGREPAGGIMTKTPDMPRPFWLYYFNTEAIRAAATRVIEAGGKVITPPVQVPGGGWILHATDPQGAMFALVAPGE